MKYCIPNELFNRIQYPSGGTTEVELDGIFREIAYKLPNAEDVEIRRETWHSACDVCSRLGVLLERKEAEAGESDINLSPSMPGRKFQRVVAAKLGSEYTTEFEVHMVESDSGEVVPHAQFKSTPSDGRCSIIASYAPMFSDETQIAGEWRPTVPSYVIERYGECIAHGALARLYAMRGEGAMARMHAVAYNNDLNRFSFGLITSGMRKHLLIDVEDWLVNTGAANGNG